MILGTSYVVRDWSLGGFGLEDFNGKVAVGDHLVVQFVIPHQGLDVSFTTEAVIVRSSEKKRFIAGVFLHLSECERELLRFAMHGSTRNGHLPWSSESPARVEMPVTPISLVPTPDEAPSPSRGQVLVRRFIYSLLYYGAGAALGLAVLLTLYWYFFRLDLNYAVISLPLHPVISQDVARCEAVLVTEGASVEADQPLLQLEDDLLRREYETSQLLLATAKEDLRTAKARVETERKRLAFYQKASQEKLLSAKELVTSLDNQYRTAKQILDRYRELLRTKAESVQRVEEAEGRCAQLSYLLIQAKAELAIAENAVLAVNNGDFYDHTRLVGDMPQFLVNLEDAKERQRIAEERVRVTKQHLRRLTYRAPFRGKVTKILKPSGSAVNRGEVLLIIEKAGEAAVIDAFVTQDDANYLSLGSQASVWIPALDRTYRAQIVMLDRTSGFLSEMQAHLKESQLRYNWRGQQDHSAYVQLAIVDELSAAEQQALTGGMPVTVSVAKRPAFWTNIRRWLSR
jgi:multidrug resistance efflux pump